MQRVARIAVLSTYPPTQCGLATFSAALVEHLPPSVGAGVVRVVDGPETHPAGEVVAHLVNGSPSSARAAVAVLDSYDVAVVQHEYGIFGGPDGEDVVALVESLRVPVVLVLHTVLQAPSDRQRSILVRLLAAAATIVTMTETARDRVLKGYGVDPRRVRLVPHGATVHGAPGAGPTAAGTHARPVVLTWGLIGPGKGIEWAIEAMPALRDLNPRYLVAGKTHPKVLAAQGDSYRESLRELAAARGVDDLVELDESYLAVPELTRLIGRADVVLLPYDSVDQVTSGVLIEAVAAGRPVVSTAFPHAVELLSGGSGLVVPQRDPRAIAAALRRVLTEPRLAADMSAAGARQSPELLWGSVARRYARLAAELVAGRPALAASS